MVHPPHTAAASTALRRVVEVAAPPVTSVLVVLPVYNEGRFARRVARQLLEFAAGHAEYRFRIVDDGSHDGSADEFRTQLEGHPRCEVLARTENGGKGRAIRDGFADAREEHLLFVDGDLAYSLNHLPKLVEALREHPIAIGSRALATQPYHRDRLPRRLLRHAFNGMVRKVLDLSFADTQAGIKGFRRDAAETVFARQRIPGFTFDVEMLHVARKHGLSVAEVPVVVSRAHAATRSTVRLVGDATRSFGQILRIRWHEAHGRYA